MARTTDRDYSNARKLYITTDLTLEEVADKLNLSISTLRKKSAKESWRLFKQSTAVDRNKSIIDLVFADIAFYTDLKENLKNSMKENTNNPKQLEILNKTYIAADKRLLELMSVKLEEDE